MPLVWTANDFFPGFYFTPALGDVRAPSRVTPTLAVMKTRSLCFEEPPLLPAGHGHQGQTRGLRGELRMCLCSGQMPTEKHTAGILSESPDLLPNTQLHLSSNLKYKNQPKTRKEPANQSFTEISTSVCVLQAVLLVHKKHSSTHRQASEYNYSLFNCQISMHYLKGKKKKKLDDTSTSKKTDFCLKN